MLKKKMMLWICSGVQHYGGGHAQGDDHAKEDGLAQGHDHT